MSATCVKYAVNLQRNTSKCFVPRAGLDIRYCSWNNLAKSGNMYDVERVMSDASSPG